MLEKYSDLRQKIRETIYKKPEYEKCISLSKKYLIMLSNEKDKSELTYDLLIANYYLALGYKKLNQYKLAIEYAFKALKYTKHFELDYDHIMTKWLIAETKFELGDSEYAIKTYHECKEMFEKLNQKRYVICMQYNIYKIQNDDELMLELIKEFEQHLIGNNDNGNYTYLDEAQKDNLLQEMYIELTNIYINKGKINKVFELLKSIKNSELKVELEKKLIA